MDLIIRDARLRHQEGLVDIGIAGGRIETIAHGSPGVPPRSWMQPVT